MHFCTKFHVNPFHGCWRISVWTKVVNQPTISRTMPLANLQTPQLSVKGITYPALIIYVFSMLKYEVKSHCGHMGLTPLISVPTHSHPSSCLFTHQVTSVEIAVSKIYGSRGVKQVMRGQQRNRGEIKCFWDARLTEKMDQWDCAQLIHNQCDCEWWARRVNKQTRFKRTANQFAVTQEKIKHSKDYILKAMLDCACLHLMQQFLNQERGPMFTCCYSLTRRLV